MNDHVYCVFWERNDGDGDLVEIYKTYADAESYIESLPGPTQLEYYIEGWEVVSFKRRPSNKEMSL